MPADVDRYYDEVKRDNPSYSDEQAWATAWSIYCKHKNPGSDHCHKAPGEYLKQGMTGRLVARALGAATASTLEQFRDEVKKDGAAGVKWLEGFERRVLDAVKDEVAKIKRDKATSRWAGPELEEAVKRVNEMVKTFASTGDPKDAYFSWPVDHALDEVDDPEQYADGPPRGTTPFSPLQRMLRQETDTAKKFADRFFGKYSLRTRAEMRKSLQGEDAATFGKAFEGFMSGIFEKPFKQVMEQFARDLGG